MHLIFLSLIAHVQKSNSHPIDLVQAREKYSLMEIE